MPRIALLVIGLLLLGLLVVAMFPSIESQQTADPQTNTLLPDMLRDWPMHTLTVDRESMLRGGPQTRFHGILAKDVHAADLAARLGTVENTERMPTLIKQWGRIKKVGPVEAVDGQGAVFSTTFKEGMLDVFIYQDHVYGCFRAPSGY